MGFVIHWHESAMELHVFPIPIPPPISLSTWSLWVFPVHQARALVSCIQPGLVICFTLDRILVSMLFSLNIPPSPCPRVQKSVLYICVSFSVLHIGLSLPSFSIPYIYVSLLYWSLSFWLTSLYMMGSSFIHLWVILKPGSACLLKLVSYSLWPCVWTRITKCQGVFCGKYFWHKGACESFQIAPLPAVRSSFRDYHP